MIRVLVADDEELLREGFRLILESEPGLEVVGEACDGLEVVRLARELTPDVVLMDVRMPQLDGIEATRRILEVDAVSLPRVVMLTTFDVDELVYQAIRAGASGFLLKATAGRDLAAAIRRVHAGEALLAPTLVRRLMDRFAAGPAPSIESERVAELTARELEVLCLIARGHSNGEIGQALVVSGATVKTHVNRIFLKLGVRDRAQAVVVAYESGLVRPGASSDVRL